MPQRIFSLSSSVRTTGGESIPNCKKNFDTIGLKLEKLGVTKTEIAGARGSMKLRADGEACIPVMENSRCAGGICHIFEATCMTYCTAHSDCTASQYCDKPQFVCRVKEENGVITTLSNIACKSGIKVGIACSECSEVSVVWWWWWCCSLLLLFFSNSPFSNDFLIVPNYFSPFFFELSFFFNNSRLIISRLAFPLREQARNVLRYG